MVPIRPASFPDDAEAVLAIWREFIASPSVSLDFQGNDADFANLPGKYAPPGGCVLLAEDAHGIAGCVALRPVSESICEMKRLYVRPRARGQGLGARLVEEALARGRQAGYREMRLDALPEFERARDIYFRLGFTPAEPITFNPVPGTVFLGLMLD